MIRSPSRGRRAGFTLIEVLLVLVILVVISSLGIMTFDGIRKRANIDAARVMIGAIESALDFYKNSVRSYPTTEQGLEALRTAPGDLRNPGRWDGPYLKRNAVLLDPWDSPYQYQYDQATDNFRVWSAGPNGVDGDEDDIDNQATQRE